MARSFPAGARAPGVVGGPQRPSRLSLRASVAGKWLGMLQEIEPQLARAAFVVNPKTAPYYDFYLRGAKVVGPSLAIEPVLTPIENDAADIERAIATFAHAGPKGGLVVPGDSTTNAHR